MRKQLKDTFGDDKINWNPFIQSLKDSTAHGPRAPLLIRAYYYDASFKQEDKMNLEDLDYMKKVRDNDFVEVRLGRLKTDHSGARRQKGVDTLIAIDMVSMAYENQYDVAVLLAGDDDFLDVVKAVKNAGKNVYGAFFLGHVSEELQYEFDSRFFLDKGKLEKLRT